MEPRLQVLMHRNNDGQLEKGERVELEGLVEWIQNMSLLRAQALNLLP